MALRLSRSAPTVTTAGNDLVTSLGDLATAAGRWLETQPVTREIPAHAERARLASAEAVEHAGDWAGATATRAKEKTARAASATRTGVINLLVVGALLWWLDRTLTQHEAPT